MSEIYDAVTAELNVQMIERVRMTIAKHWAQNRSNEMYDLCYSLEKVGLKIPTLYCQGFTVHGDDCGLLLHHDGECRWK